MVHGRLSFRYILPLVVMEWEKPSSLRRLWMSVQTVLVVSRDRSLARSLETDANHRAVTLKFVVAGNVQQVREVNWKETAIDAVLWVDDKIPISETEPTEIETAGLIGTVRQKGYSKPMVAGSTNPAQRHQQRAAGCDYELAVKQEPLTTGPILADLVKILKF
jgi:hypothetical protein